MSACHPELEDYLDRLYAAFPIAAEAAHEYTIEPVASGRYALKSDGEAVSEADRPEGLVATLVNHCNRRAVECAPHVLVHAGGVEWDGKGVVLAAAMERGKTTLTAGLVRAGFRYLTDEAVAFTRDTTLIVPYPKPLTLDRGSWPMFSELEPHEPFPTDTYKSSQWQVMPAAIRDDAVGTVCPARFVIFPEYEAGSTTELVPISRAQALIELARNTFRFGQEGVPALAVLAEVVRGADVYRLPNGDLGAAVRCITDLVTSASPATTPTV